MGALNSAHIFGTLVPVEEPSTASISGSEKSRSTHRKSGGVKAATSASSGSVSRRNCVFSHAVIVKSGRAANRRFAAALPCLLAVLLIGDHEIGETKAGAIGRHRP